jgi:hypothetical protein
VIYELPEDACSFTTSVEGRDQQGRSAAFIYPDPAENGAMIHYGLGEDGRFVLLNCEGRKVTDIPMNSGINTFMLPTGTAPGLYVALMIGKDRTESRKLVIR